jgi:hypothetical protein
MIRLADTKLKRVSRFLQAAVSFAAHEVHQEARHEEFGP